MHAVQNQDTEDPLVENAVLLGGYAVRAVKRRWLIAASCFLATLGLTLLFLLVSSPLYRVQTRVLVSQTDRMTQLIAPSRIVVPATRHPDESPIASVPELVKSRETLLWLAEHLDLEKRWQATRTPVGRVVDAGVLWIFGRPSAEDRQDQLLKHLDEHITAAATGDILTITVEWHEAQTALDITSSIQSRFLEREKAVQLSQIKDTVGILDKELATHKGELRTAEANLHEAADSATALLERNFRNRRNKQLPDLETVAKLEREVQKRRETISRMEATHEVRISEAQAQLNSLRASLGDTHPDVAAAQRNLNLQARRPDGLAKLQDEEQRMSSELARIMPNISAAQLFEALMQGPGPVDPGLETALTEYRRRAETYNTVRERLEAARLELQTQEAAFDYAHTVTQPPVLPRRPVKPDPIGIVLVGTLAAAFLAFVVAVLADILSRRVQESWQITRFLRLPVVAELERR